MHVTIRVDKESNAQAIANALRDEGWDVRVEHMEIHLEPPVKWFTITATWKF